MSLTTTELEELLRLALAALRGQASVAAPVTLPAGIAPTQFEPGAAGPTLAEWLVTYRSIINERGYKDQTIKNRAAALKHIEAVLGTRPLRAIKPHEIATQLKQFSPHTACRFLGELRDVYVEAIANGSAETSPAAHVKPPRAPGLRKRLTLETWQSMLTLSKTGPQRWVPAMLLLARLAEPARDPQPVGAHLHQRGHESGHCANTARPPTRRNDCDLPRRSRPDRRRLENS